MIDLVLVTSHLEREIVSVLQDALLFIPAWESESLSMHVIIFFNNVGKNLPHNQEKIREKRATLSYPSTKVKANSVTHLSLILRFTQNLRSFNVVFD